MNLKKKWKFDKKFLEFQQQKTILRYKGFDCLNDVFFEIERDKHGW